MTLEEAQHNLEELRGIADNGGDLASHKAEIEELYWQLCRKTLRKCNCKNVLQDALFECYARLRVTTPKKYKIMAETKARLVRGVVIQWKYNHYTNANITDEIAREFLAAFPMREDWFEVLPAKVEKAPEKVATSPEKVASSSTKVATPKKKKRK